MTYIGRSENRENIKDFIDISRRISISSLSINDKKEETQKMNEYLSIEF